MVYDMQSLKVLVLAGGHSSRMGSPKHLLPLAKGPLYLHFIEILHEALPEITVHHVSLAERSILDDTLRNGTALLPSADDATPVSIQLEIILDTSNRDIGPAAGLLAAHCLDPAATWLVIACDYPLLEAAAVRQLVQSYEPPVTCFSNADGFSEPLLGIWSPNALGSLKENVENGRSGPSFTTKKLNGKLIVPTDQGWLVNVNTRQEWTAAKARMQ